MSHRVGIGEPRKGNDRPEAQHREDCTYEPHDDGPASSLDPVDLSGDVSHDVGEREEEEPAVGGDGAELDSLRSTDVRQDDHDTHEGQEDVVVPRSAIGIRRADGGR